MTFSFSEQLIADTIKTFYEEEGIVITASGFREAW
jgi:hypothetical protein